MSVQRSGPTPPFFEYVTSKALIPHHNTPTEALLNLIHGQFEWVEIPRFQRGISWDRDNVEEFLQSRSVLLGNVILGQFARQDNQFPNLPERFGTYTVLVDGLQRFAVGTMLLSLLHNEVLASNPNRESDAVHFAGLAARVAPLGPVYLHNDLEFRNHPRRAISEQYQRLRRALETWIQEQLANGHAASLAGLVVNTFLNRQIAVDIYFNFGSTLEIMQTFLGINTVRVDLGPVDLVRAHIVEKATSSSWGPNEIDDVENEFTSTFIRDNRPDTELLPLAGVILSLLLEGYGRRIFPSWDSNHLLQDEVDRFVEFVQAFKSNQDNPYLREIRECGSIPFAILIAYYYARSIHAGQDAPSFLQGGSRENAELHRFLIACYRLLLSGSIGRTREYAENILMGNLNTSLSDIADAMSNRFVGVSVDDELDRQWLVTVLNRVDPNRAKRVFNAMLLPNKREGFGTRPFTPFIYGRRAHQFHVDHLIPQRLLQPNAPGAEEGNTLRNLAPLPANQNRVARATNCSSKLGRGGIYEAYLNSTTHAVHPYCQWLVTVHYPQITTPSDLDRQELLEPNRTPDIGSSRIKYISEYLLPRI